MQDSLTVANVTPLCEVPSSRVLITTSKPCNNVSLAARRGVINTPRMKMLPVVHVPMQSVADDPHTATQGTQ